MDEAEWGGRDGFLNRPGNENDDRLAQRRDRCRRPITETADEIADVDADISDESRRLAAYYRTLSLARPISQPEVAQ